MTAEVRCRVEAACVVTTAGVGSIGCERRLASGDGDSSGLAVHLAPRRSAMVVFVFYKLPRRRRATMAIRRRVRVRG